MVAVFCVAVEMLFVPVRHLTPSTGLAPVTVRVTAPVPLHVPAGETTVLPLVAVPDLTLVIWPTAHSLANPSASPTNDCSSDRSLSPKN